MTCRTCEALRAEVAWLRKAHDDLLERLSRPAQAIPPGALPSWLPGQTGAGPQGPALQTFSDQQGQTWVTVNGGQVKLEDYERFVRGEIGAVLTDGSVVSREETERATRLLDSMINGGRG